MGWTSDTPITDSQRQPGLRHARSCIASVAESIDRGAEAIYVSGHVMADSLYV